MTLDKMLYQQAYRSYRQWNEAEANARVCDVLWAYTCRGVVVAT